MINRTLIRLKIVQLIYAFYQNGGKNIDMAEKELLFSLSKAYDLYNYMLLLIVSALAMSGALSATGAGNLIGGFIADIAARFNNNYVIGLVFFLFPFLCAQFMSNRGAMLIFFPIAIAVCHRIGGDPRGLLLLIETGVLAAFMTPLPTAAVPYMMAYGGYDQRDLFRGGWLFVVLGCVVCVGWKLAGLPFGLGAAVPGAIACAAALVGVSLATYKKHPSVFLDAA